MDTQHEWAKSKALHSNPQQFSDFKIFYKSFAMIAFKKDVLDVAHENSWDILMHFINFLDFIEYNFSPIVFMIPVHILLIQRLIGTFLLNFIQANIIYFFKVKVVLWIGIFAIEWVCNMNIINTFY
jgi:hypothetical protein